MKKVIAGLPSASVMVLSISAIATFAVTGCATKPTYQTTTQAGPKIITNAQGVPNYYLVKRGDTVSQIASNYRLNYRQIGAMNNLDSKYTIYTGQWLKLWEGQPVPAPAALNRYNTTYTEPRYNAPIYRPPVSTPSPYTASNTVSKPLPNAGTQSPAYNPNANINTNVNTGTAQALGYEYPSRSPVIRNFDASSGNMGMWFAGKVGDPVLASQAGTVLYAGDGLPEYGNLIMIRHSDNYITAYAHNSQLLVKEGDQVQRSQQIARMGNSGQTNQVALEFQVRLNGSPIDPRTVLGR